MSASSAFFASAERLFERAEVVSFDVFDTLLERPFGRPTDLFDHVAAEADRIAGRPIDFARARPAAERTARARARREGALEIDLDAIYDVLSERLSLGKRAIAELRALELAAERRFLVPRPAGQALYARAAALGKRIVYVSDMYLPSGFLLEVLGARGYGAHEGVFVSSEVGLTKGSGRLFDHVASKLGVAPTRIVHVGDHPRGDVTRPAERGIVTLHLPQALERFARSPAYTRVVGGAVPGRTRHPRRLASRALLAHVARTLYDAPDAALPRSLFGGDPYRLGVQGFGPLLLGFAKWLVETAIANGYERLFFLARDGRVMMDAYRIVAAAYPGAPTATYLLCSRRAANVASIHTAADLASRAMPRRAPSPIWELLDGRFGLARGAIPLDVLARHGMTPDTLISTPDVDRVRALLYDLAPWLLDVAADERAAYLAYLRTLGVTRDGRSAVVDIGYRGTMQASIDALLGGGTRLGGLYLLSTYEGEPLVTQRGLPIDGYLGRLVDTTRSAHALRTYIPVYETLFSGTDTSLVRFRRGAGGVSEPVFMPEDPREARRVALVTEVHRGALALCARTVAAFGEDFARLEIDRDDALATLNAYLGRPDAEDAVLLEDVPFENAYCAAGAIPIVPPGGRGEGMWLEGALARRHGAHPVGERLMRLAFALYGSALGRAVRVLPKAAVHLTIGRAMSVDAAREAVRNPVGFTRGRVAALRGVVRRAPRR